MPPGFPFGKTEGLPNSSSQDHHPCLPEEMHAIAGSTAEKDVLVLGRAAVSRNGKQSVYTSRFGKKSAIVDWSLQ